MPKKIAKLADEGFTKAVRLMALVHPNEGTSSIVGGIMKASNATISVSAVIDEDLDFIYPHTQTLLKALDKQTSYALSKSSNGSLVVTSGARQVSVKSAEPYFEIKPVLAQATLSNDFTNGLRYVNQITGSNENQIQSHTVLCSASSVVACNKNSSLILEHWTNANFPTNFILSKESVKVICKAAESREVKAYGLRDNAFTIYFEDHSTVTCTLMAGSWPNIEKILQENFIQGYGEMPIGNLWEAVNSIGGFGPLFKITSLLSAECGDASHSLEELLPQVAFVSENLLTVSGLKTKRVFFKDNMMLFYPENEMVRGAISYKRV